MFFVKLLINLPRILSGDIDDDDACAESRRKGCDKCGGGDFRLNTFFQVRCQLHDPAFNVLFSDRVVKREDFRQCRRRRVIALPEYAYLFIDSFAAIVPSPSDDVGPKPFHVFGADIQNSIFKRAHQPLVRAGCIETTTDLLHVDISEPQGLCAVHQCENALCFCQLTNLPGGECEAAHIGDMRK